MTLFWLLWTFWKKPRKTNLSQKTAHPWSSYWLMETQTFTTQWKVYKTIKKIVELSICLGEVNQEKKFKKMSRMLLVEPSFAWALALMYTLASWMLWPNRTMFWLGNSTVHKSVLHFFQSLLASVDHHAIYCQFWLMLQEIYKHLHLSFDNSC